MIKSNDIFRDFAQQSKVPPPKIPTKLILPSIKDSSPMSNYEDYEEGMGNITNAVKNLGISTNSELRDPSPLKRNGIKIPPKTSKNQSQGKKFRTLINVYANGCSSHDFGPFVADIFSSTNTRKKAIRENYEEANLTKEFQQPAINESIENSEEDNQYVFLENNSDELLDSQDNNNSNQNFHSTDPHNLALMLFGQSNPNSKIPNPVGHYLRNVPSTDKVTSNKIQQQQIISLTDNNNSLNQHTNIPLNSNKSNNIHDSDSSSHPIDIFPSLCYAPRPGGGKLIGMNAKHQISSFRAFQSNIRLIHKIKRNLNTKMTILENDVIALRKRESVHNEYSNSIPPLPNTNPMLPKKFHKRRKNISTVTHTTSNADVDSETSQRLQPHPPPPLTDSEVMNPSPKSMSSSNNSIENNVNNNNNNYFSSKQHGLPSEDSAISEGVPDDTASTSTITNTTTINNINPNTKQDDLKETNYYHNHLSSQTAEVGSESKPGRVSLSKEVALQQQVEELDQLLSQETAENKMIRLQLKTLVKRIDTLEGVHHNRTKNRS